MRIFLYIAQFILLIFLSALSCGVTALPQIANYQYDGSQVAENAQSYNYGAATKLRNNGVWSPPEALSRIAKEGYFFAFADGFFVTNRVPTTLDLLKNAERLPNGALRVDATTLNQIGAAEARGGKAFSGLEAVIQQSKPATWQGSLTGGRQTVIKYVDPATGQTRFTVHSVTDGAGSVVHRDFDSVLLPSGQQVVK